jgi:hypothetical protein
MSVLNLSKLFRLPKVLIDPIDITDDATDPTGMTRENSCLNGKSPMLFPGGASHTASGGSRVLSKSSTSRSARAQALKRRVLRNDDALLSDSEKNHLVAVSQYFPSLTVRLKAALEQSLQS